MNAISKLLSIDGYIQVNKTLIKLFGLHEAILIGELCAEYNYWEQNNMLVDDMFYSTRENIEANTGLNDHYQRKAIATLKGAEILISEKKGLPAKNYYKINFDKLLITLTSSDSPDEGLDTDLVNDINKNKEINIKKENKVLSKDNTTEFDFGKPKQQKQSLYTKCVNLIDTKTTDKETRALFIDWLNMLLEKYREKGKPLYLNVFKGKLNMIDKFSKKDWKDIIEYNIQKGYEGFYPIPTYAKLKRNFSDVNSNIDEGIEKPVVSMTNEDYEKEATKIAELEAKGVQCRF